MLFTDTETIPTRDQLQRIVRLCGSNQALAWLAHAQAVVAAGTLDGEDVHTLGTVFIQLVADTLRQMPDPLPYRLIFELSVGASAPNPPPPWPEPDLWEQVQQTQPGKLTTVHVTLIGIPTQVVTRPTLTVIRLDNPSIPPPLPSGVPVPSTVPPTTYLVIVGAAQWRRVAATVRRGDDPLIIHGWQYYDPVQQAIMVLTLQVMTQQQQQSQDQFYQHLIQQRDKPDKP